MLFHPSPFPLNARQGFLTSTDVSIHVDPCLFPTSVETHTNIWRYFRFVAIFQLFFTPPFMRTALFIWFFPPPWSSTVTQAHFHPGSRFKLSLPCHTKIHSTPRPPPPTPSRPPILDQCEPLSEAGRKCSTRIYHSIISPLHRLQKQRKLCKSANMISRLW